MFKILFFCEEAAETLGEVLKRSLAVINSFEEAIKVNLKEFNSNNIGGEKKKGIESFYKKDLCLVLHLLVTQNEL